ncbi:acetyl-CoA decarbonylase/synthase complex subunit delta [Methanomassiliicoccus luminyensis]|uniref:acetyl-CoA decarbonylase/synthase complex subunit delta n=1 Tax=Methanomassiliicoccus luminyensis TaxID=1080712 RepID=UPI0003683639|nr:acetyl-CoA decarbonylase/synthase complex subunit delta [Methanomassiliicoccus luminyensis]
MVEVPVPKEKWSGKVGVETLGASSSEGGSRSPLTIGGEAGMPFLSYEGLGHRQLIAGEVVDTADGLIDLAVKPFGGAIGDPAAWAKKWVEEFHADIVCLKLQSTNPEGKNASPEEAAETVKKVLSAVSVPVIVYGCGSEEKDAKTMEAVSNAAPKERLLLGNAEENAYKSISAAAMANRHGIVAFSNLDINLAKQMNILLTDFGVKLDNVVMDPLMAGLGMGLEYSYSVNERIRIAALMGDRMLQMPMLCDITSSWEAREATEEDAKWGDAEERGTWWEATTGLAALVSGADILVVRSPKAAAILQDAITDLRGGK